MSPRGRSLVGEQGRRNAQPRLRPFAMGRARANDIACLLRCFSSHEQPLITTWMHPATLTNFNRSYRLGALSGGNSFDHLVGAGEQPLIERQSRSILIVTHAREIKPGINFLCSTKEELVEGHESTGTQWISDAAEGDFYKKSLCAQNRHEVKMVWEYACPIGDKVILRERYVRVAASNHLGKIAMYNADATGKVRRLRGEQVVGCLLSHQIIDSCTVSGASFRFANSLRQRDPRPAARDINELTNSKWVAF